MCLYSETCHTHTLTIEKLIMPHLGSISNLIISALAIVGVGVITIITKAVLVLLKI